MASTTGSSAGGAVTVKWFPMYDITYTTTPVWYEHADAGKVVGADSMPLTPVTLDMQQHPRRTPPYGHPGGAGDVYSLKVRAR